MSEDCFEFGDCASARLERIYEYLDGALSRADLCSVQDHLSTCPECSAEYDLECIIRSVVRRSCSEPAPQDLKTRIMVRIDQIRIEGSHSSSAH